MSSPCDHGWRETPTGDGSWTLVHEGLGEGCHSSAGAWRQAVERYARPCALDEAGDDVRGVHLLDVGTGLGLNLAAALALADARGRALHAVTLERDARVIERGLALYARPALQDGPWARPHARVRTALAAALQRPGRPVPLGPLGPQAPSGALVLLLGDARATLAAHEPPAAFADGFDAVFLDPFSPSRAPELWDERFLARVARFLRPTGWLSTYSAAFAVRLALARAGLRVGRGPRVGRKGEGTLASPTLEPPPLAPRLARRLARRAGTAVPAG